MNFRPPVFPNPAKDFVIFNIQLKDRQFESTLEVRDLSGRIVYTLGGIVGDQMVEWKTENLPSGIYFYQLVGDGSGESQSGKVILNK